MPNLRCPYCGKRYGIRTRVKTRERLCGICGYIGEYSEFEEPIAGREKKSLSLKP